jgi:hypothetical protein
MRTQAKQGGNGMKIIRVSLIVFGIIAGLIVLSVAVIFLLPESKETKYATDGHGMIRLEHFIAINTTPDKVWEFFMNMDKNYATWYPHEHVRWKWTKGKPFELGSTLYSEQYMLGELGKLNGTISESVPNKKITIELSFPASIISPKLEWILTDKGKETVFTAVTYVKLNKVFRILFRSQMEKSIEGMEKHVAVEGENLKKILENKE